MSTHLQLFDGCATVAKGHRVIDANDCVDMINLDEFFELMLFLLLESLPVLSEVFGLGGRSYF